MLKEKNKLTFTINDLLEEVKGDNDSKKRAQQELEKLKANIAIREKELNDLKPKVKKYSEIKYIYLRHTNMDIKKYVYHSMTK